MAIQAQIEVLESLSALDASLKDLNEALQKEREALESKRSQRNLLEERRSRVQQSVSDMDRTRSELVTELRQMSIQIEKSREKLARCRTEREANAAQREIEELRKLHRDREVEHERLQTLLEQARGDIGQTEKEREELARELGSVEGPVESQIRELEDDIKSRSEQRANLIAKLQPVLYRRYELVRKRRGSAVAWTSDGTCSACHIRLRPMLFQKLTQGTELGECPSCNRILYFRREAMQAEEPLEE